MLRSDLSVSVNVNKEITLDVERLKKIFRIPKPETYDSDIYVNLLQRSKNMQFTSHIIKNSLKKLSKNSKNPEEFSQKYEEIKNKNYQHLDSLVVILSRLVDDPQIRSKIENIQTLSAKSTESNPKSQSLTKTSIGTKYLNVPECYHQKWLINRPFLSYNFVCVPTNWTSEGTEFIVLSAKDKTRLLCNDLIGCLTGCNGKFIKARRLGDSLMFEFAPQIDSQMKAQCHRILNVAISYSLVVSFIEEKSTFRYGKIYQALSSAMDQLIKEYMIVIVELEQRMENMDFQTFWFKIQPSAWVLQILADLVVKIDQIHPNGGSLLQVLMDYSDSYATIKKAKELNLFLVKSAFVPYNAILMSWITRGVVVDHFSEFFIENTNKEPTSNWHNDRYSIVRHESIPNPLKQYADKVYKTGKYLNAIRLCGIYDDTTELKSTKNIQVEYDEKLTLITEAVETAFDCASNKLVKIIRDKNNLSDCLESIGNFFLFFKGDFVVHFLDFAGDEIQKYVKDIVPGRLKTYFDLAVRTSSLADDKFFGFMSIRLLPYDLVNMLHRVYLQTPDEDGPHDLVGLEAIVFDYEFEWPLSIILDKQSLHYYQILCRHILFCKYVERQLSRVSLCCKGSGHVMKTAWLLRYQMFGFIQNLLRYMSNDVITTNWGVLVSDIVLAKSVDEMIEKHTKFLDTSLKLFMLTDVPILETLYSIMSACINFCDAIQKLDRNKEFFLSTVDDCDNFDSLEEKVDKLSSIFMCDVARLSKGIVELSATNQDNRICNLLYSLDFNSFYDKII